MPTGSRARAGRSSRTPVTRPISKKPKNTSRPSARSWPRMTASSARSTPVGCDERKAKMRRMKWLVGAAAAAGMLATAAGPASADMHRGGILRLVSASAGGTLDPKINYTLQYWTMYQYTYDGLLTFKHAAGSDGFTIVPDLAEAMPESQNGGKTYVFKLRKGIKFANG